MKHRILEVLKNENKYVSGQELCDMFNVSRTAIWKNIKSLKEEGYEIDSVNNKGYRLIKSPNIVNEVSVKSELNTNWIGRYIEYYDEIDSTNIRAKHLGEENGEDGSVIIANTQTSGRGRRGNKWESKKGDSISFTILLCPETRAEKASGLTLLAAMAVAKAINNINGIEARIKWPNDIVVNGKKVVGILTEMSTDMEYVNYVVVGIGINVNTVEFPKEISNIATSLKLEAGTEINRSRLIADTLYNFEKYYEIFIQTNDLTLLSEEYNNILVNRNKEVYIVDRQNELNKIKRTAVGIDKEGRLIVKDEKGDFEKIISGEVSVRGIYGYI